MTKPYPPSTSKTSHQWLQSLEEAAVEAGEETPEIVEVAKIEAVEEEIETEEETGEELTQTGVPNTHQIHQMAAVTAIMLTETKLGTVWHPTPAHG